MPKIKIHNVETNSEIEREMTSAELKQYEKELDRVAQQEKDKSDALSRKLALLEKLGITEEEAKLLLS